MTDELKSFDEMRKDFVWSTRASYYYQAVKRMLLNMFDANVLPSKEPMLPVGQRTTAAFWNYHFYHQMLRDNILIDAYLLGEEIVPKYDKKIVRGKEYITVKFYPISHIKEE